jgi:hypothetical protein
MKNKILLWAISLVFILSACSQAYSDKPSKDNRGNKVEEEIWALEETYFTNLYKANYEGVLALVHSQFLGWPGGLAQPIDGEESARFMKQLIPKPTSCSIMIERAGIRLIGNIALTQYTLHVNCGNSADAKKIPSSRITHTWIKESAGWKLLGGISYDIHGYNTP